MSEAAREAGTDDMLWRAEVLAPLRATVACMEGRLQEQEAALGRATREAEHASADRLAHAGLERPYGSGDDTRSWREIAIHEEATLLSHQRTVETLKSALARLPDAQQTY